MENNNDHWAVFLSDKADKQLLVHQLSGKSKPTIFARFNGQQGALFSAIAVKQLIEEEELHDHVEVATTANRHLRYLSAGEQKKALLHYLLLQQPNFIIADDPLANLDAASQSSLLAQLQQIAAHTPIIQLINRVGDCLPFINNAVSVDDNNNIVQYKDVAEFINQYRQQQALVLPGNIPVSDNRYEPMADPLIQFEKVTIQYEDRVILKDISWQINTGEFWHLSGPNGSGKTTLLSLITGDNPKGYGQNLLLFGKRKGSGESVWSVKEKIGYFTSAITDLFSRHTTVEQMIIGGFFDSVGLYIKPSARQIKLADEWLALTGMLPVKKKLFHTLSLGRQRMILIVRAMVKHPPLLILDEPTAGLDDANVVIITALINKIAGESNTAILYVSHRAEKGLAPRFLFKLTPHASGSTGNIETAS